MAGSEKAWVTGSTCRQIRGRRNVHAIGTGANRADHIAMAAGSRSGCADVECEAHRIEPPLGLSPQILAKQDEDPPSVDLVGAPLEEIELLEPVEMAQRRRFRDTRRGAQAGHVDRPAGTIGNVELKDHVPTRLTEDNRREAGSALLPAPDDDPCQSFPLFLLVMVPSPRRENHAFDDGSGELELDSDSLLVVCGGHGGLAPDLR